MNPDRQSGWRLLDAHLHLHDSAFSGMDSGELNSPRITARLVNGTHPSDWKAVHELSETGETKVLRAYGVHPWKVDNLPPDWEEQLRERLEKDGTSVGEIGLDHWIEVKDERWQIEVFERQLQIASDLGLPPSIHCLRAWGLLMDCLKGGPNLEKGFLVHGFGGSKEVLYQLADLGGYFSFSAYGADPKRKRMRDAARACPPDRLLAETDAPDMVPPEDVCRHPLKDKEGNRIHHPLEIETAYHFLGEVRDVKESDLAEQIEENFIRLFGPLS